MWKIRSALTLETTTQVTHGNFSFLTRQKVLTDGSFFNGQY